MTTQRKVTKEEILNYLYTTQGRWAFFWDIEDHLNLPHEYSLKKGMRVPNKELLKRLKKLMRRNMITGCLCGCRGDFEITFEGLDYINKCDTITEKYFIEQGIYPYE